jgi:nucleotide-binding universal stress UspA family protein
MKLDFFNLTLQEFCMTMFKKILVPVDGSTTSDKALDFALLLARDNHGEVRMIHAIDELSFLNSHEYSGELINLARENGTQILHKAKIAANALAIPADTKLIDFPGKRLGDTVVEEARMWGADLIVVGTHGRRGIGRVLLGSGAEQVIRLSPIPVLIIRSNET